jgi:hypothetical protein
MGIKLVNGIETPLTAEEEAEIVEKNSNANRTARKLEDIKDMRLDRLKETDWYSNSDVTMSDAMKTYRQNLRDIPANHTDEAAYDLLLTRDASGNLTHSVWSKP